MVHIKLKNHLAVNQKLLFGGPSKLRPISFIRNEHIFLFWLNPMGHSKFHITLTPSAYYRTAGAPLHLPMQAPPHPLLPFFLSRTEALNVHVKLSDLTRPDLIRTSNPCSDMQQVFSFTILMVHTVRCSIAVNKMC